MTKDTAPKLKIGFVLDDGMDHPDGVQQYVLTLGEWLKKNGHEVRYLTGESHKKIEGLIELSKNVKVSFNGNKLSIPIWPRLAKIKSTLEQEKFDVIHIQEPFSPLMGGRVLGSLPSKTAVFATFHILPLNNSMFYKLGNTLTSLSTRRSMKRIDKHFAVSKPAQNFARRVYKINSEVLGNPIKLPPKPAKGKEFAETDILKIVFLGRLVHRKGCMTLLQAINHLDKSYKEKINVKIGGTGRDRQTLEDYVKSQKLSKIVKFHGFIEEKDKLGFLRDADLAVFPSKGGESFGIVLTEAMASGGPVVLAGDNPGYRSVIEDDNALFDPNDYIELSRKIGDFIDNRSKLADIFVVQQELVKQYDIEEIGKRLLVNFNSIVQNKNK